MSDPNFLVETPRLFLSYLQAEDDSHCDFLVSLYNSPEFLASIGGKPTSIVTREAARKTLAGRFRNEHARNGYGTYLVSLKPEDVGEDKLGALKQATPIGTVGLMKGEAPDCCEAPDIGFAILPGYMRKGYTKEAALGIMEYLEREKGLKDVLGFCDPKNEGSKAVLGSLGFEYRGERPLRVFGGELSAVWTKPGMAENLAVYGLLQSEPTYATLTVQLKPELDKSFRGRIIHITGAAQCTSEKRHALELIPGVKSLLHLYDFRRTT